MTTVDALKELSHRHFLCFALDDLIKTGAPPPAAAAVLDPRLLASAALAVLTLLPSPRLPRWRCRTQR